ncbi:hypothetical protein [Streptomyces sp. NPDC006610]|uniref:hypothetical protein n=1 Tax=Streptomyces sp. NPDC006610 TaxID=3154584 RepID=UPI0033B9FF98
MTGERERLEPLQAKADEVLAGWPGWDGESPYLELVAIDPVTRTRLGHRFVPVAAGRRLRLVREAS